MTSSTPYDRRRKNPAFREAWNAIQPVDGRRAKKTGPRKRRHIARIEQFLEELAHTSNVAAAAAVAEISVGQVYRLRRNDPDFARRWYAALTEGYDNLEMEMLQHLRAGENPPGGTEKRKFDTATALRCLTAHRETVAREKGRRTLADEVATIAAINAKIDALRAHAQASDAAVRKARRTAAKQAGAPASAPKAPDHG